MLNLTDLMLDAHHMSLIHQYLSTKDIIIFYTTSISIIKLSHQPLYKNLLLYEYPFLTYENKSYSFLTKNVYSNLHKIGNHIVFYNYDVNSSIVNFEHSIFIYICLKTQGFDNIIAYLGTLNNNDRLYIIGYQYAIINCFNITWEIDYLVLSAYNKFAKPYFHVKGYDKLFDFDGNNNKTNESHYIVKMTTSLKILTRKNIMWDYPDLLRFIDPKKAHLIKPFKSCTISNRNYVHKIDCKNHQICKMLNWQKE